MESLCEQRRKNAESLQRLLLKEQQRIKELEDDLDKWKIKCEHLEKTRRLGYHYPGWYNSVYKNCETNKRASIPSLTRTKSNINKSLKY